MLDFLFYSVHIIQLSHFYTHDTVCMYMTLAILTSKRHLRAHVYLLLSLLYSTCNTPSLRTLIAMYVCTLTLHIYPYLTVVKISLSCFNPSRSFLWRLLFQKLSAVLPVQTPLNTLLHIVSDYYSRPSRCFLISMAGRGLERAPLKHRKYQFGDNSPCLPMPYLFAWINCHMVYSNFCKPTDLSRARSSPSRHLQDRWQISILL